MSVSFPTHQYVLEGSHVRLRPLKEADWPLLLSWYNNSTVLYFAEGDTVSGYDLLDLQAIYRHIGQAALIFVIEYDQTPIGDCWLQQMNLDRIRQQYPEFDCRRIDLTIGELAYWGRGVGTACIELLSAFAFNHEGADYVFGCDIADYNPASLRAFQKVGYRVIGTYEQPPGSKASQVHDVALSRHQWLGAK